jgi:hypothetical protein
MDNSEYVGRYGDTLRRLTQQQMQTGQGGFGGPGVVGGADSPGIAPVRMGQPRSTRDMLSEPQQQAPAAEKSGGMGGMDPSAMMGMFGGGGGGGGEMMSGGAGFTSGAGSGGGMMYAADGGDLLDGDTVVGERGPEVVRKQGDSAFVVPNHQLPPGVIDEAGAMGAPPAGVMSEQKPTTWKDLAAEMPKAEQNNLVKQIEQAHGPIKAVYAATTTREGEEPKAKNKREMALYLAEVALRTISNMGTGRYTGAMGSAAAFSDAMLDTETRRGRVSQMQQEKADKASETKRLEDRSDAETRRKEGREDTEATRKRKEKLEDDARDHKQAIELARIQAKLLREKGQRTSIQTAEDGTLKLVDLETGEAVEVTEEVEETTPVKGSRGRGTTGGKTSKVRKPVKVAPKSNASGIDQDTILTKITQVENELRKDNKLMRELRSKFKSDSTQVEGELRRMAREKVQGDVSSLSGGPGPSGGKVTDFRDMK